MLPEAAEAKKLGNECMKQDKFLEALLHYTKAIKLEDEDATLYSNRSLAFLKAQQFFHAKEDAEKVIELSPKWTKGYFRKGEVDFAAELYNDALISYEMGLVLEPEEKGLLAAVAKTEKALAKQKAAERNLPMYGGLIGLLFGVGMVVFDLITSDKPIIAADALRVLVIVCVSAIGFFCTRAYRSFLRLQRTSLMDPPEDLMGNMSSSESPPSKSSPPQGTGARQRPRATET